MATLTTPKTDYYLGLKMKISGRDIAFKPKTAINQIKTEGLELGLAPGEKVNLGTVENGITEIISAFSDKEAGTKAVTDIKSAVKGIPVIEPLVEKALSAVLTIEAFHIKKSPTHKADGTTKLLPLPKPGANGEITLQEDKANYQQPNLFTVAVSATWPNDGSDQNESGFPFTLTGIYLAVTNEGALSDQALGL